MWFYIIYVTRIHRGKIEVMPSGETKHCSIYPRNSLSQYIFDMLLIFPGRTSAFCQVFDLVRRSFQCIGIQIWISRNGWQKWPFSSKVRQGNVIACHPYKCLFWNIVHQTCQKPLRVIWELILMRYSPNNMITCLIMWPWRNLRQDDLHGNTVLDIRPRLHHEICWYCSASFDTFHLIDLCKTMEGLSKVMEKEALLQIFIFPPFR